ncbi:ATP-binding protein [Pseudooceanicola sp.]|uniref:ATP-binding protein n=1 Tax=Pseudooceanicola sp. TaxID=1914328 RepID=UPI00261A9D08|nr:ATP-binding protein [Pseudooceanicola sp.]MDF1854587.1 ATP-binding protein [Pseudooceanicola sp.]
MADSDPGWPPFDRGSELSFYGNAVCVRWALSWVMAGLHDLLHDPEDRGIVELVLAEALNNVVEHAYGAGRQGEVSLAVDHTANGLQVRIRDHGAPMPEGRLPLGDLANARTARMDAPESGFGWFLIRDLARDIDYERRGDANILKFRIAVGVTIRPH